jgi:hypothetical protein
MLMLIIILNCNTLFMKMIKWIVTHIRNLSKNQTHIKESKIIFKFIKSRLLTNQKKNFKNKIPKLINIIYNQSNKIRIKPNSFWNNSEKHSISVYQIFKSAKNIVPNLLRINLHQTFKIIFNLIFSPLQLIPNNNLFIHKKLIIMKTKKVFLLKAIVLQKK